MLKINAINRGRQPMPTYATSQSAGMDLRELDAVGLGHKIYQRLEHGHEQKFRHIPAINSSRSLRL